MAVARGHPPRARWLAFSHLSRDSGGVERVLRRHRWSDVVAGALTYTAALYFSYVATFIYFANTPYRPDGPYGNRTCQQPHVIFGQICRDLTEKGMTSAGRLGLGAALLVGFLLVAIVARRFVAALLIIPVITVPYVATDRHVWLASAFVSLIAVPVIAGLRLHSCATSLVRFRWLPLGLLSLGTAVGIFLSNIPPVWTPPVPIVSLSANRSTFPTYELSRIFCSATSACVVTGDRLRRSGSENAVVVMNDGKWGVPVILRGPAGSLNGLYRLACSSADTCISTGIDQASTLPVATYEGGRWGERGLSVPGRHSTLFSSTNTCSPGGRCWAMVDQITYGSVGPSHTWSYAVGLRNGHWLPPYRIGGFGLRIRGWPVIDVFARDMACWSASSCTVLGRAVTGHGSSFAPFLQTETNGKWSRPSMLPTNPGHGFSATVAIGGAGSTGLSCSSAGNCLVSGSEGPGGNQGGVEQEADGRWRAPVALGIASPKDSSTVLAVTCSTAQFCVATGSSSPSANGPTAPFAQVERGGRWLPPSIMKSSDLGRAIFLAGLECPTDSSCDLVGNLAGNPSARSASYVARYDESAWSWSLASIDGQWLNLWLQGLSCAQQGPCWVSGTISGSNNSSTGVVARL